MKIAVIGYSGSGKSTLAQKLGEKYNAEVLHLDTVHWLPGWQERDRQEEKELVCEFMDGHTSWVIDGNYSKLSYDRRMEEADKIIFMKFNRFVCLYRVVKRYYEYKGKVRGSMTQGCSEKIDWEFVSWILYKGRTKAHRKRYNRVCTDYAHKTVVIRNQRELDQFKSAELKNK